MTNLYQEIHKVVLNEIIAREATLEVQREDRAIIVEATEVTKEVIGTILESIERNWKA